MLFAFFFSLLYKNHVTINTQATLVSVESFGFEQGGESQTIFSDFSYSNNLFFAAFNSDEQREYLKLRYPNNNSSFLCQNKDNYAYFVNVTEKSGKLEFPVAMDTVYYYKLVECGDATRIQVKLTNRFTNPSTHLDIRWVGIIKAKTIMLIVFCLILVYWFVNWALHFNVQIWIHYMFTLTFIFAVILDVTRLFEFKELDTHDVAPFLTPLRIIIEVLSAIIAFTTLLLASKGWCIVRDEISLKEMILSFIYSIVFFVLITLPQYLYLGVFELPVFLLSLIFVGLYVRELIVSINDASLHILAHMLAISNEGIDPQTTPVYQKHLMYQYFEYAVIGGCTLVLVKICVSMFIDIPLWMSETLSDLIETILLITVEIIFRLRASTATGYTTIDNSEDIQLTDIEGISGTSFGDRGGRRWEQGMPLPAMPKLVKNRTIRDEEQPQEAPPQPKVVLTSPDGTESISVMIEKNDLDE